MTDVRSGTRSATVLGEYLWARRAAVQPEAVGLVREANRRVPGLRREEVAKLASISPEYYLRLEQGHDREPSDQVLRGIAKALLLDASAEQHLLRLRRIQLRSPYSAPEQGEFEATERVAQLLEGWSSTPAMVISGNFDVVLVNEAAAELGDRRLRQGLNLVESVFSDGGRDEPDWEDGAGRVLGALRYHGNPYDRRFQELVGRLSIRDADFRRLWARHDARPVPHGRMRVGGDGSPRSRATCNTFEIPGTDGLLLIVFTEDTL